MAWKQGTQEPFWTTSNDIMGKPGIQLKVIESSTGPGPDLKDALWSFEDFPGQVSVK